MLFGDSIIAGYGLDESDSLAVKLASSINKQQPRVKVINAGVSGETTSAGLSRLAWSLKRNSPDIVLLALGGNDVLRGLNPATTRNNLDAMLKILQAQDVQVIFSKVQAPANLGQEYIKQLDAVYTELAQKYDVPLYPFLLQDVFSKPHFMQRDGIHPNAAGVNIIAKSLGDYIIEFMADK